MKISTISAYVLVYLLARGHWNLMVPVRAEVESDGSSGSASADAGSASTNGSVASSTVAEPAANEGLTASADAGSTAGDGSGHVAGSDADGSTSGNDAGHVAGGAAEAGPSEGGKAPRTVELGSLYPDFYTSGVHILDETTDDKYKDDKKIAAERLLADMKKTVDELSAALDDVDIRNPEEVVEKLEGKLYELAVESRELNEIVRPGDMMYYGSFPDGHHRYDGGADDLIEREKKWKDNMMYYSGFPDGHHRYDAGADDLIEREKKWKDNVMYHNGFPDGWHFGDPETLKEVRRYEIKVEAEAVTVKIEAKEEEIERVKKQIDELNTELNTLETDVEKLKGQHKELENKLLGLDASLIKLYKDDAEGNTVLMEENTDFELKNDNGDVIFEFKDGSLSTLVKLCDREIWKKGDNEIYKPNYVAYNETLKRIVVRESGRELKYYANTF